MLKEGCSFRALMASYHLIKEDKNKDFVLYVDESHGGGVESGLQKMIPASTPAKNAAANGGLKAAPSSGRLVSLDVFRGLTVVLMIIVDDAGGILPAINHSPWNGLTLADYVMPFFLFMVGVSLGLVYKNMPSRATASKKALLRALKLLILGIFLQGGFFHGINNLTYGADIEQIRWMGTLQRIAVAYFVAALCEIWLRNDEKVSSPSSLLKKYQWHWFVMVILTTVYLMLLYGVYVPDYEYQFPYEASVDAKTFMVKCGVRGDTGPSCNAAGVIDRTILGIQHLYRRPIYARTKQCSINSPDYGPIPPDAPSWCKAPFDPEGILSTVMAVVACLLGLQYGHIIIHFKEHINRLTLWLVPSSILIVVGVLCDAFGMHINKALYSLSYTCVTNGAAGILLAVIYVVVDVYGYRRSSLMFEWIGMHALMIYVLVACNVLPFILQGFYWRHPDNNIFSLVGVGRKKH